MTGPFDPGSAAARGAETVHAAFDDYRRRFGKVTRRARGRFEVRDWHGIRRDTVERVDLHTHAVTYAVRALGSQLGARLADPELWHRIKEHYLHAIMGRDDFELAQSFYNSATRRVFSHTGVDPRIDFVADEFPVPYPSWEMASARIYAARRLDTVVLSKVLEHAGFRAPFRDLEGDAGLAAERIEAAVVGVFGSPEIDALDVLRPVFIRNKGAYLVGRVRRQDWRIPVLMALVHEEEGIAVDAVLLTEAEASIVFSFARWYFHADVESPREVIGFLGSILPRKHLSELYLSLGYLKHSKTEFYRDLMVQITGTDERFVPAPGQRGLVMAVFTLPSYDYVFKVIKDSFPPSKRGISRQTVLDKYRQVLRRDRVGRLVDFHEFEHLTFPRERFDGELLAELLEVAGKTVEVRDGDVILEHLYVERRVLPLDIYLRQAGPTEAEAAVRDLGVALRDLAAADIFPGDMLLKNFGVTRHGRVVFYDYDELGMLTDYRFRVKPDAWHPDLELADEPWFPVAENDIFPEEMRTFLGLSGPLLELFIEEHGDLFGVEFWHGTQERNRRGEVIDIFPYSESRRLRRGVRVAVGGARPRVEEGHERTHRVSR